MRRTEDLVQEMSTMAVVRGRKYVTALILTFTLVTVVYVYYAVKFSQTHGAAELNIAEIRATLFADLSSPVPQLTSAADVVLPATFDSRNETFACRTASLMNMTFPVCHYTAQNDDTVTRYLLRGKYFEADEVSRFLRLFRRDRRLQLVDIGANVGLYSLPAARLTNVLAVEPNWRSMARLVKAVHLGGVVSNITLVHNAISNVRATLNMGVHPTNQGNAFLINTTKCKATPINLPCDTLSPTRTILLNDLLPLMRSKSALMKVDVEGHEVNVFTDATAGQFFDQIDVPLVFMEWTLCKRHSTDIVQRLLNFFYSRNYTVVNVDSSKLDKYYLKWPENVLLKKLTHTELRF